MKTSNGLKPFLPGLGLVAVLVGMLLPGPASAQEEIRLSDEDVAVYNLAGRVELVAGGGGDVVVEVMPGGADASRLQLDVIQVEGREALVVRYPDDQVVYPEMGRGSRTQIRVRSDGTFGGGGRGDRVDIRGSGSGLEAWADLRILVPAGKNMAVFLAVGEAHAEGVESNLLIDTGSGDVTATGVTGDLEVDTGSGDVVVEDLSGDLTLDTGSGEVQVAGVRGREVNLDTGSGEVTARDITADSFEVDTGSGRVTLSGISSPDVYVDTGSGEVEIELLTDVDDLTVDTGSGSVTLYLPDGLGADVEVDTGSGGIDVDVPLEVREVKRDYIRGTLGDGRGRIVIDTGSGHIRLLRG